MYESNKEEIIIHPISSSIDIEYIRAELNTAIEELDYDEVLVKSEELDEIINNYMHFIKKTQ